MMKMKLYAILFVMLSTVSFAQGNPEKREKVKALKVAFLTEKLALTSEEAQKFWPIYNTFEEKQFEIRYKKLRSLNQQLVDNNEEKFTDQMAQQLLNQYENNEEELYQLRKKFNKDLCTVFSPKKVLLLKKYEDDFNRNLLRQMRERSK